MMTSFQYSPLLWLVVIYGANCQLYKMLVLIQKHNSNNTCIFDIFCTLHGCIPAICPGEDTLPRGQQPVLKHFK